MLCDFFELLNLKGDLGDLGELGLKGDLGLSTNSSSLSTAVVVSGSVSGCGVDFRAISDSAPVALADDRSELRVAGWVQDAMSRVHSLLVPELCHNSQDRIAEAEQ